MLTNKEFQELTVEERSVYFESLTEEQVGQLTKLQAEEYQLWKDGVNSVNNSSSEEEALNLEEVAKEYFKNNPSNDSILVTEDGQIFHNNTRGENIALNYCKGKTGKKGDMTFVAFKKEE